jgi:hypothetical protein
MRNDPAFAGGPSASAHHTTTSTIKGLAGAGGGEEVRRHVFRLEFRNEDVLQSHDRIRKYNVAASKAAELSYNMGTMTTNINNATKNAFSSHDDIEANRQLERQKLQDACMHYLGVVHGMRKDVSRTARHFVKAANVVTISIPNPTATPTINGNVNLNNPSATPVASNQTSTLKKGVIGKSTPPISRVINKSMFPKDSNNKNKNTSAGNEQGNTPQDARDLELEDLSSSDSDTST